MAFAAQLSIPTFSDLKTLWRLAVPVVITQLGMMMMGIVDTIMVGHLSAQALGAIALGNLYVYGCMMFGMGTLSALDPIVSQAVGARDASAVRRGMQRGLLLMALLAVPIGAVMSQAEAVLAALRQPPELLPMAGGFARVSTLGVVPFLGFMVLRLSLQAMSRTRAALATIVLANLINVGLNWLLVYGHWGFPELGAVGSAWSTVCSRWFMFGCLFLLGRAELWPKFWPIERGAGDRAALLKMLKLGTPLGGQMLLEFGVFATVGLFMGLLGATAVAGHQIAMNLASVTFMVPLGLSSSAAVLVGQAVGRQDSEAARRMARAAIATSTAFMALAALAMLALPRPLAQIYSFEEPVLQIAVVLIPVAGFFQVFDGLQVVCLGVLRGIGDTRAPVLIAAVGYWVLGLPVSIALGFWLKLGPAGLWWGLVFGLVATGLTLSQRVRQQLRGPLRRVAIDRSKLLEAP